MMVSNNVSESTDAVLGWNRVLVEKQDQLSAAILAVQRKDSRLATLFTFSEDSQLSSFEEFEQSLERLCRTYSDRGVSRFVTEKLNPHFQTLQQFTDAITAATQSQSTAALCWGCILIVIKCGCIFTDNLEDIMNQIEDLQTTIPRCSLEIDIYPKDPGLRFALEDLFRDFVDYCLVILKCLRRNPFLNFVRSLWSSSMKRDLRGMRARIQRHVQTFDRKTNTAMQRRLQQVHEQTSALSKTQSNAAAVIEFPLETLNLPRNEGFVGREEELASLHMFMGTNRSCDEIVSCVVHGVGGDGKTQLALEYSYKHKKQYDAIFWVEAANAFGLLRSFGAIGRALKLFDGDDIKQPELEKTMAWLKTTDRKWLLVFDNVEAWESISSYWPPSSRAPSSIIVTAQIYSGRWAKHEIELGPLSTRTGSEMLLSQSGLSEIAPYDPRRRQAEDIAKLLGGSPLWINQAAGLMDLLKLDFGAFLSLSQTSNNMFGDQNLGENIWRYRNQAVSQVFDRLFEKLPTDSVDLLFMLSFMSPDSTRQDMLLAEHNSMELSFLNPRNTNRLLIMIAKLVEGRLISQISKPSPSGKGAGVVVLTMHRGVQIGVVQKLNKDPDLRQSAFDKVVTLLREQYPPPSKVMQPESQSWSLITKILPHILSLLAAFDNSQPAVLGDVSQSPIQGSLRFAELLVDVGGMNMYDRGFSRDAQVLLGRAEFILDNVHHPVNSAIRGDIATVRGLITDALGISARKEGEHVRKECIKIRQAVFDGMRPEDRTIEDEIVLYNAQTDYVCSLQCFNRFDEVEEHVEKCLTMYKNWGPEDKYPYEYAKYYNHMAYVYLYRGKGAEALLAAQKGSELMARAEPNTQMSVIFTFDWATILFQTGAVDAAFKEHLRLLKERIKGCGELNVLTLTSRIHIGIMYFLVKDYYQAENWLRESLALDQLIPGPTPVENVARAQYYLAQALFQKDAKSREALDLDKSAKDSLHGLLLLDGSNSMESYRSPPDYPILFDYIVTWEFRLVTPREVKLTGSAANGDSGSDLSGHRFHDCKNIENDVYIIGLGVIQAPGRELFE